MPSLLASPVIAHSMAIPCVVGYGVVTAPAVVAFCANAPLGAAVHTKTMTTIAVRRVMAQFYQAQGISALAPALFHHGGREQPPNGGSTSRCRLPADVSPLVCRVGRWHGTHFE